MKIKILLLTSSLMLLAATSLNAADVMHYHKTMIVINKQPINSFNWGGSYLGGQLGYKRNRETAEVTSPKPEAVVDSPEVRGEIAGIYAGFNKAIKDNIFAGVETDFLWHKTRGVVSASKKDGDFGTLFAKWSGSTRVRLAWAYNRFLPYLAGGVTYAKFNATPPYVYSNYVKEVLLSETNSRLGWTLGAGLDYAANDNILLRMEYRYNNYGKKNFTVDLRPEFSEEYVLNVKRTNYHELRLGLAYKF